MLLIFSLTYNAHLLSILVRIANHLVLRLVDCFTTKNFHAGARFKQNVDFKKLASVLEICCHELLCDVLSSRLQIIFHSSDVSRSPYISSIA